MHGNKQIKSIQEPVTVNEATGWAKNDHFLMFITPVYDDVGRRPIYENVRLFSRSKNILNVTKLYLIFKYSLHNFRETILH